MTDQFVQFSLPEGHKLQWPMKVTQHDIAKKACFFQNISTFLLSTICRIMLPSWRSQVAITNKGHTAWHRKEGKLLSERLYFLFSTIFRILLPPRRSQVTMTNEGHTTWHRKEGKLFSEHFYFLLFTIFRILHDVSTICRILQYAPDFWIGLLVSYDVLV